MNIEMRNGAESHQEEILEQALERLMGGESLDTILSQAGTDATWLGPLLSTVAEVQAMRATVPVPPAEASLTRFLAEAERLADHPVQPTPPRWWERLADSLRLPAGGLPRLATAAVSVALVTLTLTLGGALLLGTESAAQSILPGQPLYPIKRLGEEMYLRLPQSSQSRDARTNQYQKRRRDEVRQLLNRRLEARVSFRGTVETLGPDFLTVSGLLAQMDSRTQIEGSLGTGASVLVQARTRSDGTLLAERVVVEEPGQPVVVPSSTPTPTPQPTATPEPTVTPTATPSATPTPTQEPTATPQPTATFTPSPTDTPTPTPTPSPTATPQPTATATVTPTLLPTEETPEPPESETNQNDNGGEDNSNEGEDNNNGESGNDNANQNGDESGNDNTNDGGNDNANDNGNDNNDNGHDNDNNDDSNDNSDEEDNSNDDENDNA